MFEVLLDNFCENLTGWHVSGIISAKNEIAWAERSKDI
jgi:hypothetical protein